MDVFLLGCIIGFITATPLGPIGMLCLRKTLKHGKMTGGMSGMGIALAYCIASYISAVGVTIIISFIKQEQVFLRIAGGLLLGFFALRNMRYKPVDETVSRKKRRKSGPFLSFFILTIANPVTFISFSAIFSGIGVCHGNVCVATAMKTAFGVAVGAAVFWLILAELLEHFRSIASDCVLRVIHHCSTIIITIVALASLVSASLC